MRRKRIPGLKRFQGRNPNGYFVDLPWPIKQRAYHWLHHLCAKGKRERGTVPQWLFAIYVGKAKYLALNPPTSAWGRSMLAKRGGKAVQWVYRHENRHPTKAATQTHQTKARERQRRKLGLPETSRHRFLPLDGV